jgi:hypothetical protein
LRDIVEFRGVPDVTPLVSQNCLAVAKYSTKAMNFIAVLHGITFKFFKWVEEAGKNSIGSLGGNKATLNTNDSIRIMCQSVHYVLEKMPRQNKIGIHPNHHTPT